MVEKPEISPICGKKPAHAEIRVHKICVFLGRMVHTHGRIKGWGKLLKKKPPPFRITFPQNRKFGCTFSQKRICAEKTPLK